MRAGKLPGPAIALGATIIAAVGALTFSWGLAAMARPKDLKERVVALEAYAERTQTLLRRRGGNADYPAGAVCPGLSDAQLEPIRQRLGAVASGAQLSLEKVSVTRSQGPSFDPIAAVDVRIEATGAYEPTLLMLDNLSRLTPLIYVDTVDLRPHTDTVTLQLSGRFYCWTSAPR
ncbi:hypothetical protein ASD79_16025 [Caulobacter sp. Root655]|uniref:hypothetical protein n=1 Tax=Caulobacter sp. Root655 TaxID=1736578 RepID=UPI0006FA0743|nr:hypothetical protein [Caulobacter sp. Root655]KRA57820.1 hypothetical protein ASD79_16025 [Caulobacter sp. Root655]